MSDTVDSPVPTRYRHTNPVGAIIFITLGVLLLFNNFGWLPWSTWDVVWRFWPALLVIWGLQMMLGKNVISKLLVSIITVAIILFILFYVMATTDSPANSWFKQHYPNTPTPTYVSPQSTWN